MNSQSQLRITVPNPNPQIVAELEKITHTVLDVNNPQLWNQGNPKVLYGEAKQGGKQWQEDSFFTFTSPHNVVSIGCVCDGHGGYNGMIASSTVRKFLQNYFVVNSSLIENWSLNDIQMNLPKLFDQVHESLKLTFLSGEFQSLESGKVVTGKHGRYVDSLNVIRQTTGDPIHGGTTLSLCFVKLFPNGERAVVCANVGDSDCILTKTNTSEWKRISTDHGPDNPDEYKRIYKDDSHLYPTKLLFVYDKVSIFRKYACPQIFNKDGTKDLLYTSNPWANGLHPTNVRFDPASYAVTPQDVLHDTTCIAMTRSIGDFYAHPFGLSHKPSITVSHLEPSNEYLLTLASDGIWDCWKFEDFSRYIIKQYKENNNSIISLVQITLKDSITKAIDNFGIHHFDDASVVIFSIPSSSDIISGKFDIKSPISFPRSINDSMVLGSPVESSVSTPFAKTLGFGHK